MSNGTTLHKWPTGGCRNCPIARNECNKEWCHYTVAHIFASFWPSFIYYFIYYSFGVGSIFSMKASLKNPPHFTDVATLPCVIFVTFSNWQWSLDRFFASPCQFTLRDVLCQVDWVEVRLMFKLFNLHVSRDISLYLCCNLCLTLRVLC